jgi:hypothetical protein
MFRAVGRVGKECDEDYDWMCDIGWNQGISLSYFKSLNMLLSDDIWDFGNGSELSSLLMLLFAFITGILLLNVLIAVISNVFTKTYDDAEKVFWENRLALTEFSSMSKILKKIVKEFRKWHTDDQSDTAAERISFEKYPGWLKGHALLGEEFFLYWYLYRLEKRPPLLERLHNFYTHASWDEILFPSETFERLLYGTHYDTEYDFMTEMWKKEIDWYGHKHKHGLVSHLLPTWAMIALWSFLIRCTVFLTFFINLVCALVVFVLGLFSFGLLWPEPMKAWLFDVSQGQKTVGKYNGLDQSEAN